MTEQLTGPPSARVTPRRLAKMATTSALAIGAVLAIAACGSSGSSTTSTTAKSANNASSTLRHVALRRAAAGRHAAKRRHGLDRPADGADPDVHLPDHPRAPTRRPGRSRWSPTCSCRCTRDPNGAKPEVDEDLSAAEPPVFSNGDKTVAITIKPGLKWSNGAPIDRQRRRLRVLPAEGGGHGEPGQLGSVLTGRLPAQRRRASRSNGQHGDVHLDKAVNPGWFLNNNLSDTDNVYPLPSTAWNIAAAGGPHLDFTNPGQREEDLRLPGQAGRVGRDVRDQPAVAGRRRAVQAEVVQRDERLLRARSEPDVRGLAQADDVAGRRQHVHEPRLRS